MKYRLGEETMTYSGHLLHRVIADESSRYAIHGKPGGWVESEKNLAQEGLCWVASDAKVLGDATVKGDVLIADRAVVKDFAELAGSAIVKGSAMVSDHAAVSGSAIVTDMASVTDWAVVGDHSVLRGGAVRVSGCAYVSGHVILNGRVVVTDCAVVHGNAHLQDTASVIGSGVVGGNAVIGGKGLVSRSYGDYIAMSAFWLPDSPSVTWCEGSGWLSVERKDGVPEIPEAVNGLVQALKEVRHDGGREFSVELTARMMWFFGMSTDSVSGVVAITTEKGSRTVELNEYLDMMQACGTEKPVLCGLDLRSGYGHLQLGSLSTEVKYVRLR